MLEMGQSATTRRVAVPGSAANHLGEWRCWHVQIPQRPSMNISLAASWAPSICEGRASPQTTNVARHHASKANQSAVVGQGNATLILRSGRAGAKRPLERAAAAPRTSQLVLGRANCLGSWQVREITLKLPFLTRLICIATAWHCFYPGKSREEQSQASRTHSRPPVCDRQNSKHLKIKQVYPFCVYKSATRVIRKRLAGFC